MHVTGPVPNVDGKLGDVEVKHGKRVGIADEDDLQARKIGTQRFFGHHELGVLEALWALAIGVAAGVVVGGFGALVSESMVLLLWPPSLAEVRGRDALGVNLVGSCG